MLTLTVSKNQLPSKEISPFLYVAELKKDIKATNLNKCISSHEIASVNLLKHQIK